MATRKQKIIGGAFLLIVLIFILDKVQKNLAQRRLANEVRGEGESDESSATGTTQYANVPVFDPGGGVASVNEPAWYEEAWDYTVDTAESAWDWTAETAEDAWDWTAETAEDAGDWIAETATDFWDWATDW